MPGVKELKTRIRSIGSTRKITRAMQMVSAAKMRKAQNAALASRGYSDLAWELVRSVSSSFVIPEAAKQRGGLSGIYEPGSRIPPEAGRQVGMTENRLLQTFPNAKKLGLILISSNKGFVGGLNANLMNVARPFMGNQDADESARYNGQQTIVELLVMGKKARDFTVRLGKSLVAEFPKRDVYVPIETIYPLAKMVFDLYASGNYRQISVIYNQFVSTLTQKPIVKQLLPFHPHLTSPIKGEESRVPSLRWGGLGRGEVAESDYLFEPAPAQVLDHLLPRIIESQIYQAVLESDASEHSARMVMMKNATEAAGDLIADYTLTYNQLRQSKITTELSEITAGRIALE